MNKTSLRRLASSVANDFPCHRRVKGSNKVVNRRRVRRSLNRNIPQD